MAADRSDTRAYDSFAETLIAVNPSVHHGTMMGFPCLRVDGKFFASLERGTGRLIVKLPATRVEELVACGEGLPFAPNGRVFREWVQLADEAQWAPLAEEALRFVSG